MSSWLGDALLLEVKPPLNSPKVCCGDAPLVLADQLREDDGQSVS